MANKLKRKELEEKEQKKNASVLSQLKRKKTRNPILKKKNGSEIYSSLGLHFFQSKEIRSLQIYSPKSYNLQRQKESLIRHLYVKYGIPKFMYKWFDKVNFDSYIFDYVFCIAQGGSFQKLVKGILTKKECIEFLKAPDDSSFEEAVWFAKMKLKNIPIKFINGLLKKDIFQRVDIFDEEELEKYTEIIDFFAKYHEEIDKNTFDEISDFIRHSYRIHGEEPFSLKGRTVNSVKVLSNTWHIETQNLKIGKNTYWKAKDLKEPWLYEEEKNNVIWEVTELTSTKDLINEGRINRHCVGSYLLSVSNGDCVIYSLRLFDSRTLEEMRKSRITMEKRHNELVQCRGLQNRLPNPEENRIIRKFASKMNLIYEPNRNRWY